MSNKHRRLGKSQMSTEDSLAMVGLIAFSVREYERLKSRIEKLKAALEYVARHGNSGHLSGNILDECATVCQQALEEDGRLI